jgi:tRNA(Ile)-lysidine synthetase-like protein
VVRPARNAASLLRLRPKGETQFGDFRFRADERPRLLNGDQSMPNPWRIYIPRTAEPVVRQWHHGDRLTTDLKGGRRRVKRYFADAGVVGPLRTGWPVVLCEGEVIWIPGIKASQAAVRHEGKMVHYTCERIRE